jgi:hypothetical protein
MRLSERVAHIEQAAALVLIIMGRNRGDTDEQAVQRCKAAHPGQDLERGELVLAQWGGAAMSAFCYTSVAPCARSTQARGSDCWPLGIR